MGKCIGVWGEVRGDVAKCLGRVGKCVGVWGDEGVGVRKCWGKCVGRDVGKCGKICWGVGGLR